MLWLGEGQLASHPGQHHRLGVRIGKAPSSTVGTLGWMLIMLLTTTNKFPFRQQPGDFIANLTSQFFQLNKPASSRQLQLMLTS
jgi:hypothetical protein